MHCVAMIAERYCTLGRMGGIGSHPLFVLCGDVSSG